MGNYRFRLSDMMPNAWFYKLKDIGRSRNHNASHQIPCKKRLSSSSSTTTSHKPNHAQLQPPYIATDRFYLSPTNFKASDTHFPEAPRKSTKKRTKRKTVYKPSNSRLIASSVSSACSCQSNLDSSWAKFAAARAHEYIISSSDSSPRPEADFHVSPLCGFESDDIIELPYSYDGMASYSWSSSSSCKVLSSSATDIILDMNNEKSYTRTPEKLADLDTIPDLAGLPPILTKPPKHKQEAPEFQRFSSKFDDQKEDRGGSLPIKLVNEANIKTQKDGKANSHPRKSYSYSNGVKLRTNSPKLASKKMQEQGRKSVSKNQCSKTRKRSVSQGFAIVKSSFDPQKDFRDSMVEMIVENKIRASKDLEELLACYLTLNSNEYHDLIVKAFQQIWFNMPDLPM